MLAKTHALFSFLLAYIFLYYFDVEYKLIFLIIFVFSSYLPDIDTPKSKIGRRLFFISYPVKFIFGHRKFFHSIFVPSIVFIVLSYFNLDYIGLAVFLGYLSHLIGDALSKEGIMPFYPLTKFRIRGFFRVGGKIEGIILGILFAVDLILVLIYFF